MPPLYDRMAQYYDLVNAQVDADIPFFISLGRASRGDILEIGCGSGRTLLPLAKAGLKLVGLDNSPAMLDRAREQLARQSLEHDVHLVLGDMTDFDLGKRFGLVIIPFNTWLHLPDDNSRTAALQCMRRHMLPGGQLVIDTPGLESIVDVEHDGALTLEQSLVIPETGETLLQIASTRLDQERQVLNVTWIYDRVGLDGSVHRTVIPMALAYLYPQQIQRLLENNSLVLRAFWGSYDRTPYHAASERLIIVAARPENNSGS
ncbi:MAG: methyltransferase domain-containing protein [Anaerolineales bacterium]|nr:methyltransferase domain-containing protein [Anaerolineales bacterium]